MNKKFFYFVPLIIILVILAVVYFTPGSAKADTALNTDSSFENWQGVTLPTDWSYLGVTPTTTTDAHSGTYALSLDGTSFNDMSGAGQTFVADTVLPTESYVLKFWAKNDGAQGVVAFQDASNGSTDFWDFDLNEWTAPGGEDGNSPGPNQTYNFVGGADYSEIIVPAVIVSTTGEITPLIVGLSQVLIDDVSFQKDGSGPNIIQNSSFETMTQILSDNLRDWSAVLYNKNGDGGGATLSRSDSDMHTGSSAIKLNVPMGDSSTVIVYQTITGLTPGVDYRLSQWAKSGEFLGPFGTTTMMVLNGPWETATKAYHFSGSVGWQDFSSSTLGLGDNFTFFDRHQLNGVYTQYTSPIFQIPEGSDSVTIATAQDDGVMPGGDMAIVVDDFILESVGGTPNNWDGNLPVLSGAAKQRLLFVDGTYYLAFTSSTDGFLYDIYITTSTTGMAGTWSEPQVITAENIFAGEKDGQIETDIFGFEYDSVSSNFALAYRASSTMNTCFSTSTDALSWSTPTYPGVSSDFMAMRGNKVLLAVRGSTNVDHILKSVYSNDGGVTWGEPVTAYSRDVSSIGDVASEVLGAEIGGDGILHMLFYDAGDGITLPHQIIYASSTDSGASWTTEVVAGEIANDPTDLELNALSLDSEGNPGFLYFKVNDFVCEELCDITYTPRLAKRSSEGSWTTSTINSSLTTTGINGIPSFPELLFVSSSFPLMIYPGSNYYPEVAVSTSTNPYNFSIYTLAETPVVNNTSFGLAYDSVNDLAAFSYIDTTGQLTFVTSSLASSEVSVPVAPSGPILSSISTSSIGLFSWTDNSNNENGFEIGYSTNGTNYDYDVVPAGTTSVDASGLVLIPNTEYWFHIAAYNSAGSSTYAVTSTYTLANVPNIVSAVANSGTQITINYSGDASAYYVENITTGANSGWTTATSQTFGGLSCGHIYTFQVIGKNSNDVETDSSANVSVRTRACGGGGLVLNYNVAQPVATSTAAITTNPTTTISTISNNEPSSDIGSTVTSLVDHYIFTRFLYLGSTGLEVRKLQERLKELGYFTYPSITGYFGNITRQAVIKLQQEYKLKPPMGWVGPGTRGVLNNYK